MNKTVIHRRTTLGALLLALMGLSSAAASNTAVERVSVNSAGVQAVQGVNYVRPSISADGRFVAFESRSKNLVGGDTNGGSNPFFPSGDDVFVRDRVTNVTERVSVATGGAQADDRSGTPAISADGRYVAFWSTADNLVPGGTPNAAEVYVRDRVAGTTELVSVTSRGTIANDQSEYAAISANGNCVAFYCWATDMVPGDTNGIYGIFLRDRAARVTEEITVSTSGEQANGFSYQPVLSADGRFVAFASNATNLVAGDDNGQTDVFIRDRLSKTTELVSVGIDGRVADRGTFGTDDFYGRIGMSADGRCISFPSFSGNLVPPGQGGANGGVFIRDRSLNTTEKVNVSTSDSLFGGPYESSLSADGRYVAFSAYASNHWWVNTYVRDRLEKTTRRVSATLTGSEPDSASSLNAISADGRNVAFISGATNLSPNDTNHGLDVFVARLDDPESPTLRAVVTRARMVTRKDFLVAVSYQASRSANVTVQIAFPGRHVQQSKTVSAGAGTTEFLIDLKASGVPRFTKNVRVPIAARLYQPGGSSQSKGFTAIIPLPVVTVHGILTSNPHFLELEQALVRYSEGAWSNATPYSLAGEPYQTVFAFEWGSTTRDSLADGSRKLKAYIDTVVKPLTWADRVYLISHSRGANLVRWFVSMGTDNYRSAQPYCAGAVLACMPVTGAMAFPVLRPSGPVRNDVNPVAAADLSPVWPWRRAFSSSEFTASRNDDLTRLNQEQRPPNLPLLLLYGTAGAQRNTPNTFTLTAPEYTFEPGDGWVTAFSAQGIRVTPNRSNPYSLRQEVVPWCRSLNAEGFVASIEYGGLGKYHSAFFTEAQVLARVTAWLSEQ